MTKQFKRLPLAEYLRSRLDYNELTGEFIWKRKPILIPQDDVWNQNFAGKDAGSIQPNNGYLWITVDLVRYASQRLAWRMMTGQEPANQIDHIDSDKLNNAWWNLREATNQENSRNKPKRVDNQSGYKGVHWHSQNQKWTVRIGIDGRNLYVGSFDELQDAAHAYREAEIKHFGEYAFTG